MQKAGFSIIIVSYNSGDFLPACLHSIFSSKTSYDFEVVVLDNGSQVPLTLELKNHFPKVKWIDSKENLGFGKGCNLAVENSEYEHLFFVNPDTMVGPSTFEKMLNYYKILKKPGVLGPKILNGDGSLQWACRRSFPSPMSAIYKTLGLSRLFPNSKKFASYNMTYKNVDEAIELDAVSGSFFCVSKSIYDQVSGFDGDFFLYGEDLDIFYRIKKAGYTNHYFPDATVIHFKGMSFRTRRFKSYVDFYDAMLIFVNKHNEYLKYCPKKFISLGIFLAAILGFFSKLMPQWWKMTADAVLFLTVVLFLFPVNQIFDNIAVVILIGLAQLFPLIYYGDYVSSGFRLTPSLQKLLPLGVIFGVFSWYFTGIKEMLILGILPSLSFYLWRKIMHWFSYFFCVFTGQHKRVVIVGAHQGASVYFEDENIIPSYEFLGTIPFADYEIKEEAKVHLLADSFLRLADIKKHTGIKELLVVADENGNYGQLPEWSQLKKLKLGMRLIIGSPVMKTFVLVDMKNIV